MRKQVFRACGHKLLIKPEKVTGDEEEIKSEGGIIIATEETSIKAEQNKIDKGEIISLGPNCWKAFDSGEPWAKVGDIIYYARFGGTYVEHPETGEDFILLNDEDVNIVIETEEEIS